MKINNLLILTAIIFISALPFVNNTALAVDVVPPVIIAQTTATALATSTTDSAVTALQNQINDRSEKIKALDQEIKKYQDLASKASNQSLTLKNTITSLEADRKKLGLETTKIETQIDETNLNIKQIKTNITKSEDRIKWLQSSLSKSLREIYQKDDSQLILLLLSNTSISGFFNELENQKSFNRGVGEAIGSINQEKQVLESNKQNIEKTKSSLDGLKTELDDKKKVVEYAKTEQQKILNDSKNEEKTYQQMINDRVAQKNAFEKEIFDYESKIKFKLDPSSIPAGANSGLFWPLDNVIITQRFGKTVASKRLYVSGSHNGVDFGARLGTAVKAANSGTVVGTGDTDKDCPRRSFGRWILIKHNNGLATIYGHLSVISVSAGESVQAGQLIGYSGNTGYSTGPHLHISVYVSSAVNVETRPSASCPGHNYTMPIAPTDAYLDPMIYFPAYNK